MWSSLFLLSCLTALAAFLVTRKLSRSYGRLSFAIGILASILAAPLGLVAAFGAVMCSSETVQQGSLDKNGLVWFIERQGCGATTADTYRVRLGHRSWWSHTILTAYGGPTPRSVETINGSTVRIVIDPDSVSDDAPHDRLAVRVSTSGQPERALSFNRGVLE